MAKEIPAPPQFSEEAVENFNFAQAAAEAARERGEDPRLAFREAMRQRLLRQSPESSDSSQD